MVELRTVGFNDIQHWFQDFQKHSKCYEMPPEEAEYLGIFNNEELIGYFIMVVYADFVEINQGFLKPEFRHSNLPKECLRLLEYQCKKAEFTEIKLGTHNRFKSYLEFMKDNGYKPEHLIFSKRI